jgi:hypothetical protein
MASAVDSSSNLRQRRVSKLANVVIGIAKGYTGVLGQAADSVEAAEGEGEVLPTTQRQNDVAERLDNLRCLAEF